MMNMSGHLLNRDPGIDVQNNKTQKCLLRGRVSERFVLVTIFSISDGSGR